MDERMRFVLEQESGLHTMTELCRSITSRGRPAITGCGATGKGGWRRCRNGGGLRVHPNQTPEKIEAAVLELRRAHMSWGPRKLKRVLQREEPQRAWPASSTIGALLAREGLVVARKKRRRAPPYTQPFAGADAPNRVWCADFKGWFQTGDGQRIDPLTITDACSRYLLRCQQCARPTGSRCGRFSNRRFANAACRKRSAPIMARRLHHERWRDFRGWRCGG